MITDPNRSLATYAITTLLKVRPPAARLCRCGIAHADSTPILQTGTESSVDRLMRQISTFLTELTDEFKMIVVEAIRSLSLKFPQKQAAMLTFLSNMLRDEGGYDFKRTIVEAIFDMIRFVGECKETGASRSRASATRLDTDVVTSRLLQRSLTCASLSRTASSPSSRSASFTCSASRAQRRPTRPSTSGTSTTASSSRTPSSGQRPSRVSASSASRSATRRRARSAGASASSSAAASTTLMTRSGIGRPCTSRCSTRRRSPMSTSARVRQSTSNSTLERSGG